MGEGLLAEMGLGVKEKGHTMILSDIIMINV